MALGSSYKIAFVGLKPGHHEFTYEIANSFFDTYDYGPLKKGNLACVLDFNKQTESMFVLEFDLKGWVELTCDRCNEPFNYPMESKQRVIIKMTDEKDEGNDELIFLPSGASEMRVDELIYEFIVLSIPLLHNHPEDEQGVPQCDPEFLKLLDKYKTKEEEKSTDPRWDVLKNLNKN